MILTLHRQAWQQLAINFLESFNPKLKREIIIREAILAYDGYLSDVRIRHHAHDFIQKAVRLIELKQPLGETHTELWLIEWNRLNGEE